MTVTSDPFAAPTDKPQDKLSKGGADFVPLTAFGKQGRLVLIVPVSFEASVKSQFPNEKTGAEQWGPQMVANFALLTGEDTIRWTGKDESGAQIPRKHEGSIDPGKSAIVLGAVNIYSAPLIDKTEDARRTDLASTMTLGRLDQPKAWALTPPSPKDVLIAQEWLKTAEGKAFAATASELHDGRVSAASDTAPLNAAPF